MTGYDDKSTHTPPLGGPGALPEDLLRAIEAAPIGIVVSDPRLPDAPVIYVNREFSTITGYPAEELLGRNLRLLQGLGSDPKAVADMHEAVEAARPVVVELLNYRKSGEPFWMRTDIRPVFDESGRLRAFIAGQTDVTESRRAQDKLTESEANQRALTEAIPLPMLTVAMDGTVIDANTAAHEALGVAPGRLVNRPVSDFAGSDDPGHERMCDELLRAGASERIELRARKDNGEPLWLMASARNFTRGEETRSLIVFQDVSPLKRKEQALTEANEEAERNIRARMRFLAAASHDLRQPLQAMALFASALDHHVASPQGRSIVQSLKTSLRGMEEMFDSLLDMSKLDAGVMRADTHVFLVNDVFEQLEATYGPQAEAAGLDLRVVPTSLAVRSDPRLVARVLGNFLSNAIRYTRRGGIVLGVRRRGADARLMVVDTGPGIPEEQRLEIFREFRQLQGGVSGGTGLGLAIVQRLARLLGHRLEVHSCVGKGSTFGIAAPLAEDALPAPATEQDVQDWTPAVAGATVVVIDDDLDIQEGLRMILEDWDCHPIVAASAGEAVAELGRAGLKPDVILADLHLLHENSGITAIHQIREYSGIPAPAFLLTGDTEAAAGMGDNDLRVLRKPLDPMRLRSLLAGALRH
jgi:PAS domain S-box-containing protein